METVSFGKTGLKVSKLCFGTMGVGSSQWKPWVLDEADSQPLLEKCLDLGITFFDMADWYSIGESERIVGSTLLSMVPRDQLVFATKAHYAMSDDPNDQGLSRKHLLSAIDASLNRIGTDYVDIFMVHAWDPNTPVEETMETLNDIVRSGKARYLGASTMYAWQFAQMNHVARENGWTSFVNMQCQYNLLYREEEREMIPYCQNQGIAITTFSPLARGWLGGSKHKARADSDVYFNKNYGDALDLKIIELVETIASDQNATMAEVALAWVCSKQAICSPLISAASLDQLESNVNALQLELSPAEIAALDELYRPRDVVNDYVPLPLPRHLGGVLPDK
ncbi:MAG: alcohol dehydrogenase [Woeseia sp.]|nr:alcohol dehydrogenase [Woeseia sp.]|tara:strand:- start:99 stop:1109 length:1011 start_codon:yes stop_codon:yes gene_type:complete